MPTDGKSLFPPLVLTRLNLDQSEPSPDFLDTRRTPALHNGEREFVRLLCHRRLRGLIRWQEWGLCDLSGQLHEGNERLAVEELSLIVQVQLPHGIFQSIGQ